MLKIIKPFSNDSNLIKQALKNNRRAQQQLYEKYAPQMLSLCKYYIKDFQKAEEIMLNGFLKVFTKLSTFKNEGSFEGWVKRIMTWESISFLRRKSKLVFIDDMSYFEEIDEILPETLIAIEDIQGYIDELPDASKVIFNLYVIEEYKHKEIAELLNITEGTSKTQLFRARKALQKMLITNRKKHQYEGY
ncbi:MAG: RNA polymerase subunit sigma-70 [Flavobacteriaceae bacterium]|nr:MAG: RNA polymerase subunit sigma-70 [Flavobacteriaceae bacterium]